MDTFPHEAKARVRSYMEASSNGTERSWRISRDSFTSGTASQKRASTMETPRQGSSGLPTAAELYVPSLPGIPNLASHPTHPLTLYAGHIPSDPGADHGGGEGDTGRDAAIFFLLTKARRSAGKQRLLFWFNGGPGCSSFDGALMEVGPFRTVPAVQTASGEVEVRLVEGWEEYSHIVFVDQPPGTGLSYIPTNGYLHELDEGSQHLIKFLENFFTIFPELQNLDTYFAGESFAGQYIPYFASAVLNTTVPLPMSLQGIAIGNGWIDPKSQYPGYRDFAYERGLIKPGTPEADHIEKELAGCQVEMDKYTDPFSTPININNCGGVMDAVSAPFVKELNGNRVCMNVYDVRLVDDWPACGMNWPPDLPDVYEFLRQTSVVNALHATKKETGWVECDGKVGSQLRLQHSPAAVAFIPNIVERGIKVLMFAGAEDLICNYKGIEIMLDNMDWNGDKGFPSNATIEEWWLNDAQVGTWRTARNMSYAKVFAASHMVGSDLPEVTNDMILRFMDVDLSLLPGTAASSKSRIGEMDRVVIGAMSTAAGGIPLFKGGGTDWEAWYNVGSALLILLILLGIVAMYFFFRRRGLLRAKRLGLPEDFAERVPLGARLEMDDLEDDGGDSRRRRNGNGKGKGRAADIEDGDGDGGEYHDGDREVVFALGDEDDDERR